MTNRFAPISEPQKQYLMSNASITVFGGAVGSAKSYGSLLRMLRWVGDKHFVGVFFRKNESTLRSSGGLFWDAVELYQTFDPRVTYTTKPMVIKFPSGATISFMGMKDDHDKEKIRGLQFSAAVVDEANQVAPDHIMMIQSRLRTKANMIPNLALTCNPNPDHVIAKWVDWHLYPKGTVQFDKYTGQDVDIGGRTDQSKNNTIRYGVQVNGEYVFSESKQELVEKYPDICAQIPPITFTYIGATIFDNPPLLKNNPQYLSTLMNLPRLQRERDLFGNWWAVPESAGYFKRDWCGDPITHPPMNMKVKRVRAWDLAASEKSETNADPDYTVGALVSRTSTGQFFVEDIIRFRKRHGSVIDSVIEVCKRDKEYYGNVDTIIPQDPAAAGKIAAQYIVKELAASGFGCRLDKVGNRGKMERAKPFFALSEAGSVSFIKADWNDYTFSELEAFDGTGKSGHDDILDAIASGINFLAKNKTIPDFNLEVITNG
jgi:predicted phage terminase large subunit-like protein